MHASSNPLHSLVYNVIHDNPAITILLLRTIDAIVITQEVMHADSEARRILASKSLESALDCKTLRLCGGLNNN